MSATIKEGEKITVSASNRECDIHKRIQYTKLQIEAAKLKAKGMSESEIAKILGVTYQSVHRCLISFRKNALEILRDVKRLEKTGYFRTVYFASPKTQEEQKRKIEKARLSVQEKAKAGYHQGPAPLGYMRKHGKLIWNQKTKPIVELIFDEWEQGKTLTQIATSLQERMKCEIDVRLVGAVIKNPFYCGYVRWKGEPYPGKHKAIIEEERWKKLQPPKDYSVKHGAKPSFGYRWVMGRLKLDKDEKVKKVYQVFQLRKQRMSTKKIARRTELSESLVQHILRNPIYMGKTRDLKPMPKEFKTIVNSDEWWEAQRVQLISPKRLMEQQKRKGQEARNTVLDVLKHNPKTNEEIIEETGLTRQRVGNALLRLKCEGKIEKTHLFERWHLKGQHLSKIELHTRSFRGGNPPFGYKWENRKLTPDPEETRQVNEIFDLWLTEKTLAEISASTGKSITVIRRILFKPTVISKFAVEGKLVKGNWPSVVDEKKWVKAQEIRQAKSSKKYIWEKTDEKILKSFPKGAWITKFQLAKKAGVKPDTVTRHVHKLCEEGVMEEKNGKVRLLKQQEPASSITRVY